MTNSLSGIFLGETYTVWHDHDHPSPLSSTSCCLHHRWRRRQRWRLWWRLDLTFIITILYTSPCYIELCYDQTILSQLNICIEICKHMNLFSKCVLQTKPFPTPFIWICFQNVFCKQNLFQLLSHLSATQVVGMSLLWHVWLTDNDRRWCHLKLQAVSASAISRWGSGNLMKVLNS